MFAVFETGGKQYRVSPGDRLRVEKLDSPEGSLVFDRVLLVADGEEVKVGTPYVEGAKVEAEILGGGRADKVVVFKFKPKKRYRKKGGHRQPFTEVSIKKISG